MTAADKCRPVVVDGQVIRVRGGAEMTDEERGYFAEIVRAAKRKHAAEHPELAVKGFCDDCPDHEACATGWPCWKVKELSGGQS